jgi:paraquat-inducible protein B
LTDDARPDDDGTPQDDLPRARTLRGRWPGLVWAIPLAALIIVAFLGIRALSRQGVDVVVQFGYAEGVTPGDTKVLENGVEIGRVSKVRVSKDARHVDVTLRLDPRAKKALNTNTMFWLIGEKPSITDIQSIRAAVAGVIIAMAPGTGGTETREFHGLDSPPVIPPGSKGTVYYFQTNKLGSIQQGAAINYRGMAIGKIVQTGLVRPGHFRLEAFVNAPYDRLITPDSQFWSGSPLKLSLTGASLSAGIASPASVLQGAIEFDRPENGGKGPQAPADTVFPLYDDQSSARQGPAGPSVPYRLVLNGTAGDLAIDADVKMLGYTVGRIVSARLVFAPGGKPYTEAEIALYPRKFDIELPRGTDPAAWRGATDRAVERLLAQGYRAHLVQSPPFVGAHVITLATEKGAGPAHLMTGGAHPAIPVAESQGTADDLLDKADAILTKVDQIPFAEIGANVRKITASLASPQVQDSINHLDGTLRQLDQIMTEVKPQIGPMMKKLNQTADELHGTAQAARTVLSGEGAAQDRSLPDAIQQLDGAARSIRALTDYLGRHPEALIRGKAKEKK